MPKFFVCSDIHSFYTPLKKALDEKGFDPNNKDHWLVVCGDVFDRGDESNEMLHFLMSLERKILVKGNHEQLLLDCIDRGYWYSYDRSNGTFKTICDLTPNAATFEVACSAAYLKVKDFIDGMVNYFETQNYIFVHSWIPTISQRGGYHKYDEDWRNATNNRWQDAMWCNPFDMHMLDLNQTGKTIVFGHWHCSTGHKMLGHCDDEFMDAVWEPCYAEGIIGIDRCTAYTGEVNVLVIEDEFLEG